MCYMFLDASRKRLMAHLSNPPDTRAPDAAVITTVESYTGFISIVLAFFYRYGITYLTMTLHFQKLGQGEAKI